MLIALWHNLRSLLRPSVGWLTLLAALGLAIIGIQAIGIARPSGDGSMPYFMMRQMQFLPIALCAMLLVALPHHRRLVSWAYVLLGVVILMLVVLLLPFMPESIVPVRNGARRWFDLQIMLFQPSELAKVAYVLALAQYLRYRENYRTVRGLLLPLIITFIPMGLILVEPDLGTAMIFLPVLFAMLIVAGARLKHIATIILLGLVLMPAMYPLLQPHQKDRIIAMVSQIQGDTQHLAGVGFQGHKAQTLTGAGQVSGHSETHAVNLIKYNSLPEAQNDMIFAVICTRWGILGGMTVVALYLLFICGGLLAAAMNKDPFARLIAVGVTAVVFTQMFVNIGMTVGILPITGMTLPLISYGGSSLLVNFMMVGLILNVSARRPLLMAKPAFEFDTPRGKSIHRNPWPETR
jgi:cell division protein FtsW (lipid II flippase)